MRHLKRLLLSAMLVFAGTLLYAQTEISGTVVDEFGEGLPGTTVVEKGTSNGTVTDLDGKFTLKVAPGTTLVISFIGFDKLEVPAQQGMKVTLKENTSELSEIVVVGYQTQRKAALTGARHDHHIQWFAFRHRYGPHPWYRFVQLLTRPSFHH